MNLYQEILVPPNKPPIFRVILLFDEVLVEEFQTDSELRLSQYVFNVHRMAKEAHRLRERLLENVPGVSPTSDAGHAREEYG